MLFKLINIHWWLLIFNILHSASNILTYLLSSQHQWSFYLIAQLDSLFVDSLLQSTLCLNNKLIFLKFCFLSYSLLLKKKKKYVIYLLPAGLNPNYLTTKPFLFGPNLLPASPYQHHTVPLPSLSSPCQLHSKSVKPSEVSHRSCVLCVFPGPSSSIFMKDVSHIW